MFKILIQNFHLEKVIWSIKSKIKYMILAGLICALFFGVYASVTSTSTYVAKVTFYVYSNPDYVNDTGVNISSTEITQASNLLESYKQIMYSRTFLSSVLEESGLEGQYTTDSLKRRISVEPVEKTAVFSVSVYDQDPVVAMDIANAIGRLAPNKIIDVVKSGGIEILDPAELPTKPYASTSVTKSAVLGGILGIMIVAAVALFRGLFNTVVRRKYEIEDLFTIPIIGDVPLLTLKAEDKNKYILSQSSPFILREAYSNIRANLMFAGKGQKCPVYAVTSADDKEGKTVNAYNLARSYAMMGRNVLLIDADMRRSGLNQLANIQEDNGLSLYLAQLSDQYKTVQPIKNLDIIPSGEVPPNPAELLESARWKELLEDCKKKYDIIFIDFPSLGMVSDALFAVDDITGYILIVRENVTRFERDEMIVQKLEAVNATICGFIYNGISLKSPDYVYKNYQSSDKRLN